MGSFAEQPKRPSEAEIEHYVAISQGEGNLKRRMAANEWLRINAPDVLRELIEQEERARQDAETRATASAVAPAGGPNLAVFDGSKSVIHSELVVVAAVAADPDIQSLATAVLQPDDLLSDSMRYALKAILSLRADGRPVDRVLLAQAMRAEGLQNEAYVAAAVAEVLETKVDSASVPVHLEIIRKQAAVRRTAAIANELVKSAGAGDVDADAFLAEAQSKLAAMADLQYSTGWPEPQLDSFPAVPFPLHVVPKPMADFALEISQLACCPVDYFLLPALSVAGLAVGHAVGIYLKPRWVEFPALWTAFVGRPGMAKSEGIERAEEPLVAAFEDEALAHALKVAAQRGAKGEGGEVEVPLMPRTFVKDTTFEALGPILAANHQVGIILDELSGFLNGMNQYKGGKGNDRDHFLSCWSGKPLAIDRKGQEGHMPIFVRRPFLAISGPIQPARVNRIQDEAGTDDGFIDRFLFSYPAPVEQVWKEKLLTKDGPDRWCAVVKKLRGLRSRPGRLGRIEPREVRFNAAAKRRWIEWHDELCREFTAPDFPSHLQGPWSKFRTHCARLVLVLELLHLAYDPKWKGRLREIPLSSLEKAIDLVAFFKVQFRRVYAEIQGESHNNAAAEAVLDWLRRGKRHRFTEREVRDNFRRGFADNPEALDDGLLWLLSRHCIRRVPPGPRRPGRPPTQVYEVNPSLLESARKTRVYSEGVGG